MLIFEKNISRHEKLFPGMSSRSQVRCNWYHWKTPVQLNRCTNGTISVLKGSLHIPGIDNVGHSGMYVPHACAQCAVWWQAGLPWQLDTLHTQRRFSSAALHSLTYGDQWCNDTGRFYNRWLITIATIFRRWGHTSVKPINIQ